MNSEMSVDGEEAGRGVVPGRLVRVSGEAARVGGPALCVPRGEPQVELIRDRGVLQAIDVICTCGKRMRLRCVYSDTARGV